MIVEELVSVLGLEVRDTGLSQFRQSLTATIGKLGLVVAGAAAAAVAITSMAASAAGDAAKQTRLARSLGISTQEMQRLGFAAERAGGSVGGMQQMLSELQNNLDSANTEYGIGFLKDLGNLGLSAFRADKTTKGTVEMLYELANAYENATDKASAYTRIAKILGNDQSLKNLFKGGAAGLRAVMSQAPVFSSAEMAGMERFDNTKNLAERTGQKLAVELGTPLLGVATDAMEGLLKYSKSKGFESLKTDIMTILAGIIAATKELGHFYEKLSQELPEGSTGAALLVGAGLYLAKRNPAVAGAAGAAYVISAFDDTKPDDAVVMGIPHNAGPSEEQMQAWLRPLWDRLLDRAFVPPGFTTRDEAASWMKDKGKVIIENLSINVKSQEEAVRTVFDIEKREEVQKAAEKGSTGVRK